MDPLSGLSLACNILQVVHVAGKIASRATKLSRSPDGALPEDLAIENASEDLIASVDQLMSLEIAKSEGLERFAENAHNYAQEILEVLGKVRIEGKTSTWKALKKSVRSVWMESDIKRMQENLGHLERQLTTHMMTHLVDQSGNFKHVLCLMKETMHSMDDKLEEIRKLGTILASEKLRQGTETRESSTIRVIELDTTFQTVPSHLEEILNDKSGTNQVPKAATDGVAEASTLTLGDNSTSKLMLVPSTSGQSPRAIHVPFRSKCQGVACGCGCHLRQYYRTPMFLKRFIGAVTFKGVCPNHPAKLSEMKYWVPEWILNYNIQLWYERNECGTPSLGLKLQRKVPWGGEDTIIRFSFLGDTEGIKAILQSGRGTLDDVDPNHGRTPLHYAVQKGHLPACKVLLDAGADGFVDDESGVSATQKAWEHILTNRGTPDELEILKVLFPNDDLDYWQFSPLHKAVLGLEGFSLAKQLQTEVFSGAINTPDARGRTALHWGAHRGDLNAVELLLDAGADGNAVDKFKSTPLLYAVSSAIPRMIELLILRRADVNFANNRGDTPLHYAARHKDDVESVKILVQAGAQVDRKNSLGNTPFAGAAITNRLASGRYLLQNGADRLSTNKYGDTPLRETVHHNCHKFLRMLLQEGTKYDEVNTSGSTILHAVALEGDTETAEILTAFRLTGLDPQIRNARGETAMDVCENRISAPDVFKTAFSELLASLGPIS